MIVTLIARPRRFGKTSEHGVCLSASFQLRCILTEGDLFEGLDQFGKMRDTVKLQGTYPVIFLSFAG